MKRTEFNKLAKELLEHSSNVLVDKNSRYSNEDDPFANFEAGSDIIGPVSGNDGPAGSCWAYFAKHAAALRKMIHEGVTNQEDLEEKCGDMINYIIFIYAMLSDEKEEELKDEDWSMLSELSDEKEEELKDDYDEGKYIQDNLYKLKDNRSNKEKDPNDLIINAMETVANKHLFFNIDDKVHNLEVTREQSKNGYRYHIEFYVNTPLYYRRRVSYYLDIDVSFNRLIKSIASACLYCGMIPYLHSLIEDDHIRDHIFHSLFYDICSTRIDDRLDDRTKKAIKVIRSIAHNCCTIDFEEYGLYIPSQDRLDDYIDTGYMYLMVNAISYDKATEEVGCSISFIFDGDNERLDNRADVFKSTGAKGNCVYTKTFKFKL